MSKGHGQLQRSILDAHRQAFARTARAIENLTGRTAEYDRKWTAGSARTVAWIIYDQEPTESQLRSIRRAAKRLIEEGHLVRVNYAKDERESMDQQRRLVAESLVALAFEHPGRMFTADGVARECERHDKDWWKRGNPWSSSALVASGYLRAAYRRGAIKRHRRAGTDGVETFYYLPVAPAQGDSL